MSGAVAVADAAVVASDISDVREQEIAERNDDRGSWSFVPLSDVESLPELPDLERVQVVLFTAGDPKDQHKAELIMSLLLQAVRSQHGIEDSETSTKAVACLLRDLDSQSNTIFATLAPEHLAHCSTSTFEKMGVSHVVHLSCASSDPTRHHQLGIFEGQSVTFVLQGVAKPDDIEMFAHEVAKRGVIGGSVVSCSDDTIDDALVSTVAKQILAAGHEAGPVASWEDFIENFFPLWETDVVEEDPIATVEDVEQASAAVESCIAGYKSEADLLQSCLPMTDITLRDRCNQMAHRALKDLADDLPANLPKESRAGYVTQTILGFREWRRMLCDRNAAASQKVCEEAVNKHWDVVFNTLDDDLKIQMVEINGKKVPKVVELLLHFCSLYDKDEQAVGPAKQDVLRSFMMGRAQLLEQLADFSRVDEKMCQELDEMVEQIKACEFAQLMQFVAYANDIQAQQQVAFNEVLAAVEASTGEARRAADHFNKLRLKAASDIQQLSQRAVERDTQVAQNAARQLADVAEQASKNMEELAEGLGETASGIASVTTEVNKPSFWQKFGQWFLVAAAAVAGIALCVFTGPVGALIGGALLSASISTGAKMAFSQGGCLDWGDFFKSAGVGAATGLLTGGMAMGAGALASALTVGASEVVTVGANVAAFGGAGALSNSAATVIDNAAYGRKWDEGLPQAVLAGAACGAVSGAIAGGMAVHANAKSAMEKVAASQVTANDIATRQVTGAVSTGHQSALARGALAMGESVGNSVVSNGVACAFDPTNVSMVDGWQVALISAGIGTFIATSRSCRQSRKRQQVTKKLMEGDILDANGKPTKEIDHAYLHHEAIISKAEQMRRLGPGLKGSMQTDTVGTFKDGDAFSEVKRLAAPDVDTARQDFEKRLQHEGQEFRQQLKARDNLLKEKRQLVELRKNAASKAEREPLIKALQEKSAEVKKVFAEIEKTKTNFQDPQIEKKAFDVKTPASGLKKLLAGTSWTKDGAVIKRCDQCQAAKLVVELSGKLDANGDLSGGISSRNITCFPVPAAGQVYEPVNQRRDNFRVNEAARGVAIQNCLRLKTGWESAVSEEHGQTYYFNRATGEVQWEPPH